MSEEEESLPPLDMVETKKDIASKPKKKKKGNDSIMERIKTVTDELSELIEKTDNKYSVVTSITDHLLDRFLEDDTVVYYTGKKSIKILMESDDEE